jgi:hypothetical protein
MMHMLVIRILIKIKLDYGENCLKSLLNDLFLFNRKYQIWFQVSSMKLKTKWQIEKKKKGLLVTKFILYKHYSFDNTWT